MGEPMKTVKGPAIFLAQFAADQKPFNNLEDISKWAAGLGFKGIQIPSWDKRLFDLKLAAESQAYCDQLLGMLHGLGLQLTELSTHLQGQLIAVHPAYDLQFDGFAPPEVAGNSKARQEWATQQLLYRGKSQPQPEAQGACYFFRSAGVALRLSLAPAARRINRRGFRRAGPTLEADSQRL